MIGYILLKRKRGTSI